MVLGNVLILQRIFLLAIFKQTGIKQCLELTQKAVCQIFLDIFYTRMNRET